MDKTLKCVYLSEIYIFGVVRIFSQPLILKHKLDQTHKRVFHQMVSLWFQLRFYSVENTKDCHEGEC